MDFTDIKVNHNPEKNRVKFGYYDKAAHSGSEDVWDFKLNHDGGKVVTQRYYIKDGKTLHTTYIEKWEHGKGLVSNYISHIDCKACKTNWKIEEGTEYNDRFEVKFDVQEGLSVAREVRCKNCNLLYSLR